MSDPWAPSTCPGWEIIETVCKVGGECWIWYCDDCDSHGTADTMEEAREVAKAHARYAKKHYDSECCIAVSRVSP